MKKYLLKLTTLFAFAALVVSCESGADEEKSNLLPIEGSTMAVYLDVNQLIEKSGIEPQLQLLAAGVAGEFEDPKDGAFISSIIQNLDNSGIKFSEPVYGIAKADNSSELSSMFLTARVTNANNIDKLVELVGRMSDTELEFEKDGDLRYMSIEGDGYLGYNSNKIALVLARENSFDAFKSVINGPDYDLSIFGNRDAAAYINVKQFIDMSGIMYSNIGGSLNEVYNSLADNSALTFGLTFKPCAVTIDMQAHNFQETIAPTSTTLDHLALLPKGTVAVADMGFDGTAIAEIVKPMLTSDMARIYGMTVNDFNMIKNIILDAVGSLKGDITLAITELNGYIDEIDSNYYDYYWDEWVYDSYITMDLSTTNIALIADTRNEYIISNLGMAAGNMLDTKGYNHYGLDFEGGKIDIKQDGDMLRANYIVSTNSQPVYSYGDVFEVRQNLSNARWIDDIKNSYTYALVDIDALQKSDFGSSLMRYFRDNTEYPVSDIINDFVTMSSHVYFRHSQEGMELTWKFDDNGSHANALKMISQLIFNYAMEF